MNVLETLRTALSVFLKITAAKCGSIFIFCGIPQKVIIQDMLHQQTGIHSMLVTWVKTGPMQQSEGPSLSHRTEFALLGFFNLGSHGVMPKSCWHFAQGAMHDNVFMCPVVRKLEKYADDDTVVNPYQKPLALLRWVVHNFTGFGEWVLDACAGSGSMSHAALLEGRHCCSVEIDTKQCEHIKARMGTVPSVPAFDTKLLRYNCLRNIEADDDTDFMPSVDTPAEQNFRDRMFG